MKQTQKQLIVSYIEKYGSIIPAKIHGTIFQGQMLGSETIRRAQELRAAGILESAKEGRFTKFFLKAPKNVKIEVFTSEHILATSQKKLF